MTRRNPKSKGARTVTARIIYALAADIALSVEHLNKLAREYETNDTDHEVRASQVDDTLDYVGRFARNPAWPRGWKDRVIVDRIGGGGPVRAVIPLGPAKCLIVVCERRDHAGQDIASMTHRNPGDRRLIYVSDASSLDRTRGLDRNTPWVMHSYPYRDGERVIAELRARFSRAQTNLAAAVSLVDWGNLVRVGDHPLG